MKEFYRRRNLPLVQTPYKKTKKIGCNHDRNRPGAQPKAPKIPLKPCQKNRALLQARPRFLPLPHRQFKSFHKTPRHKFPNSLHPLKHFPQQIPSEQPNLPRNPRIRIFTNARLHKPIPRKQAQTIH